MQASGLIFTMDQTKQDLINAINQIGNKHGMAPAAIIHILMEITAEARSQEYRSILEASSESIEDTSEDESIQPEVIE